jgi:hypothetical protein
MAEYDVRTAYRTPSWILDMGLVLSGARQKFSFTV